MARIRESHAIAPVRDTIPVRRRPLSSDQVPVVKDTAVVVPVVSSNPADSSSAKAVRVAPTVFIDGVRSTWEDVRALDRERIEAVEILKGAAAIDQYGDDARDGIILIRTKRESKR